MIVIVCPGQGSQTPGFLQPWLADASVRSAVEAFGDACGVDIVRHGTVSDADTIRDTAVAQPLIVAAGLVALRSLREAGVASRIGGIAGHSVGEVTAAAGAGILTEGDAVHFVTERARAMAEAAAATPTGMSAVIGGDPDAVVAHAESLELEPANYNGGGQIVVAGALDALERLSAEPIRGTRVVSLQVAGAFHTRYMQSARDRLASLASDFPASDPTVRIWTNRDGSVVESGTRYIDFVVGQVATPVRWDRCMEAFTAAGVTGIVELAPAGALVGLAKRGLKGVPSVAIKTPDDIAAAIELFDAAA